MGVVGRFRHRGGRLLRLHLGVQHALMGQVGVADVVHLAILELLRLAVVPVLHRAVVAGDAAVDLGAFAALGADRHLAGQIAVVLAHGIGGGQGVIGQLIVLGDLTHQLSRRLPIRQLLAQEGVEHGAGGVQGLQVVLHVQRGKNVLRVAHRQVAGVGVVGGAVLVGGDDVGIVLLVVLGEAVGGGLGRGGLQVVQVAVLLLIVAETSLAKACVSGWVRSFRSQLAFSPTSFMPIRPMVEKWLSKVPRYRLV